MDRSRSGLRGYSLRSSPAPNWMGLTNTLTTTLSFSRRARSTRLMCPACNAPMVGTSPIEAPSARHPRATSRINPGVPTAIGGALDAGAVLDLIALSLGRGGGTVGRVRVLGPGERAVSHLLNVALGGARDLAGQVGVALHELRRLAGGQAQHVVEHEHLPVRSRPRADADSRDSKRPRHAGPDLSRHALEDDAERPRLLELLGVGQDARGLLVGLALDLEAAHLMDELRGEAKMAHDRDAHRRQPLRDLDDPAAALELDGVHSAFLDEPAGGGDRLFDRRVIRHERHVAHEQRLVRATRDRLGVVEHLVDGDRQGRRVAEHDHAQAVANEKDGDAGLVEDLRAEVVIRREHGKAPAFFLEPLDVQNRGHRGRLLRVAATFRVSALFTRPTAVGSRPALAAISSAIWPSIR